MSVADIVFVLGPPGAGKGTQCTNIKDEFGYIHLSAGDLLRAEQAAGSDDGELIADYIKNGKIVPIEITIKLLEKAIVSSGVTKVLIDGFPRDEANLAGWESAMTGKMNTKFMLYFDCNEEECLRRAMARNQNRADDNPESFRKRIATYNTSTTAVINIFKGRDLLRRINANGSPEEVWAETKQLFQISNIVAPPLPAPLPTATETHPVDLAGSTVLDLGEQDENSGGLFSMCQLL